MANSMRQFTIPADIGAVSFVGFVQYAMDNDPRADANHLSNLRTCVRIEQACYEGVRLVANGGAGLVTLYPNDWNALKAFFASVDPAALYRGTGDTAAKTAILALVLGNGYGAWTTVVNGATLVA